MVSAPGWIKRTWPVRTAARQIPGACLEFIVPDTCPACGKRPVKRDGEFCGACEETLRELPYPRCPGCGGAVDGFLERCSECLRADSRPWDRAVSVFAFGAEPRELIHRLKYGDCPYLARSLGRRMAANWRSHGNGVPDVAVPVPLHFLRQWSRGYNQAELLANHVAGQLGIPVVPALRRRRRTDRQAWLDAARRKSNAKDAFAPAAGIGRIQGKHVLLVDDVLTTGSTLAAASEVLAKAKAAAVSVLTVARG